MRNNILVIIIMTVIALQIQGCLNSKSQNYYIRKYLFYLNNKKYKEAFNLVNSMIEKKPDLSIWYYYKSKLLYDEKRNEEAEKLIIKSLQVYKKYKSKNSEFPLNEAYQSLAFIYLNNKKNKKAIEYLEKALIIDSTNAKTYRYLALNSYLIKNYKNALYYADKAIKYSNINVKDMLDLKFDILWDMKDYKGLMKLLNYNYQVCLNDSCKKNIEGEIILTNYKFGKFDEVIKFISKINKNSKSSKYLYIKGLAYLGKKDYSHAMNNFKLLYDIKKDDVLYTLQKMLLFIIKGDSINAQDCYNSLNMKKKELYENTTFKDFLDILSYNPHQKKALKEFIEAQPK